MKIYQVYQWIDSLDGESEDSFLVATFESKEDAEFCVKSRFDYLRKINAVCGYDTTNMNNDWYIQESELFPHRETTDWITEFATDLSNFY